MKKILNNKYIALIHTLIGGVVIPCVALGIFSAVAFILGISYENLNANTYFQLAAEIVQILAIGVGASISGGFVMKRYIISNPTKVLNLSTSYLGILLLIAFASGFINTPIVSHISIPVTIIYAIGAPLSCFVFYYETKRKLPLA
jgi:hypothetical protein